MTEQLCPVDGRQTVVPLRPEPLPGPATRTRDLDLCNEIADLTRRALDEFLREHPVSARVILREIVRRTRTHLEGGV